MKLPEVPLLRELNRDDETEVHLVIAGWLRTYVGTHEKPSSVDLTVERSVMYRLYQPVVKDLIARCHVVMATSAAEGFAYGWVCFDGTTLHYVCVKPKWQRLGIASLLLAEFQELPVTYTHKTADGMKLPLPKAWSYAPMRRFSEAA